MWEFIRHFVITGLSAVLAFIITSAICIVIVELFDL